MKKLIAFAISLTMIMSMFMVPVYADQQPSITNVVVNSNASNNQITVQGNISTGSGKNVTIQVLDPNGYLDYLSQTTSTDGGNFNFTLKSNSGAKGTYTMKIGGEGILTPYEKTFEFSGSVVTPSEISYVTVKADKDTSQVIVEGNISAGIGKNVTIQVLDPNGILDYIGQTISIEGGKFTFTFTPTNALKGNYTAKIGGEGVQTPYEKTFEFSGTVVIPDEISNVAIKADKATAGVTVEGSISTGSSKNVTIKVLDPNGNIEYIGQTVSTDGGKFTFAFKTNAVVEGSYTVNLGGDGISIPYQKNFEFSGGSQDQKPSAPVELKAAAGGSNEIDLTWTAVIGAASYNVYRSTTADGEYTKINSSPVTTTSYSDTGLSAKTAYFYKVTAVNTAGESDKSASVAATTPSNGGGSSSSGGSSTTATTATSKRLSGLNRIETSIAIAKEQFSDKKPDAIVLTSGEDFPDALGGSGLAYKQNAPVLLVGKSVNDSRNILDYINANLAKNKNIYVLGGTGAVSTEVSDYLTEQGYNVVRLGGIDRYETNQKIVDTLNVAKGTPIVIANGNYFADALSISSIADMKGYPVLISGQDSLSANVIKDITNIQPTTVYVIGGIGVLSANIETQIKNLNANTNIVRLGGKDRYETSIMVAEQFNLNSSTVTVASGENFPDALSGSVLAARKNSNILLINNSDVSRQKELLEKQKVTNLIVLGGEGVIGKDTVELLIQK